MNTYFQISEFSDLSSKPNVSVYASVHQCTPVYTSVCQRTPVYTSTQTDNNRLDGIDQWCLSWICNVHWTDHVTNVEIRRRTSQGVPELSHYKASPWPVRSCRETGPAVRHITSAPCLDTVRLETSEGQTTLNMVLHSRERPLSSQLRNFHCPEEGGRQSKLEEDHPFGDALLVGACRQEASLVGECR